MYDKWENLEEEINNCKKCKLCNERSNIVFGAGPKDTKIMFIGEGPGADEDRTGKLFVGKSGQLMDKAFQALDIKKENLYLTNVIKCKTQKNREPQEDEVKVCINYLRNQVILIKPKVIVLFRKYSFKIYFRKRI